MITRVRLRFDSADPISSFKKLVRTALSDYKFGIMGLHTVDGDVLPIPNESAVLGKIIEWTILDHLRRVLLQLPDLDVHSGGTRSYPDLTFEGRLLQGNRFALDVKTARRDESRARTESQISIGTFDAEYFHYPDEHVAFIMAPWSSYAAHLALIALYNYERGTARDLELLVVEKWRVATKRESSGSRSYIGASVKIDDLRAERGAFASEDDFYKYWRAQKVKDSKRQAWQTKRLKAAQSSQPTTRGRSVKTVSLVDLPLFDGADD